MTTFPFGFRLRIKHLSYRLQGKKILHFLHLGKTGGTAVKHALKQIPPGDRHVIYLHPHRVKLRDIPRGEKVFFFLRDPATRFVSGFYSRQRQGKPRHSTPWSAEEKQAFEIFSTPSQLAKALSSHEPELRKKALSAMHDIQHVRNSYWEWFENEEYLKERLSDILFIGFQETLTSDFARLKNRLDLPQTINLPTDDVQAHRTPENFDTSLDAEALENLREWYREDYRFVRICQHIVMQRQKQPENEQ